MSRTMKFSNRFLRQAAAKKIAADKILMKLKLHMILIKSLQFMLL